MPLERQVIEKKDFPIGRRGYDPEAVDIHLAAIADEVDELKASSRRRTETLASSASAQVQAIVEAAESSAAAITREAEDEAAEIRSEASKAAKTARAEAAEAAKAARAEATDQAQEYVGQVSQSTATMIQRLDAMESEMTALLESLRTGSNRLGADLALLEGNLDDVKNAVTPWPAAAAGSTVTAVDEPEPVLEADADDDSEYAEDETVLAETGPAAVAPAAAGDEDIEGARLVALNMALNGTAREETDRYLAENFTLGDRAGLLDEVYASVEG